MSRRRSNCLARWWAVLNFLVKVSKPPNQRQRLEALPLMQNKLKTQVPVKLSLLNALAFQMVILTIHRACPILKMMLIPQANKYFWKKPRRSYPKLTNGNQKYALSYANTGYVALHVKTDKKSKDVDSPMENMNSSLSMVSMKNTSLRFVRTSWNTQASVPMAIDVSSSTLRWTPARNNLSSLSFGRILSTPPCAFFKIFQTRKSYM